MLSHGCRNAYAYMTSADDLVQLRCQLYSRTQAGITCAWDCRGPGVSRFISASLNAIAANQTLWRTNLFAEVVAPGAFQGYGPNGGYTVDRSPSRSSTAPPPALYHAMTHRCTIGGVRLCGRQPARTYRTKQTSKNAARQSCRCKQDSHCSNSP
jgi:hypothetical protein